MPSISSGLRVIIWIIVGIAGVASTIILIILEPNLKYSLRKLIRLGKGGRRPSAKPVLVWGIFWLSTTLVILGTAIASSAPEPIQPTPSPTPTPVSSPTPRADNAIYQSNEIVAYVSSETVDKLSATIQFMEIYKADSLDLGSEFEFREWRLRFRSAEARIGFDSSQPSRGTIFKNVVCNIVGLR